jgi:cob(I)alamin adenosyltransferase
MDNCIMDDAITPPIMRPYSRHILICTHGDCAPGEEGEHLKAGIQVRLGILGKLRNPERVKCSTVDCLGVCSGGPIVAVYPDGIWYHHVTDEVMDRIVTEHILGDQPVEEFIFHRLYPAGQEPAYAPAVRGDAGTFQLVEPVPEPVSTATQVGGPGNSEVAEERRRLARRKRLKKGLVIVNTGEGKGKTTAALGVMLRAWGRNMRVGVMQFLKNENAKFGEIRAAHRLDIEMIPTGDGWTWTSSDLEISAEQARQAWEHARQRIISNTYDVLVLDEFTYLLHYGWLDTHEVIDWLRENKPEMLHLIITGRYAPAALIEFADLVTEMRPIKHPLRDQGIRAQPGIEF